jgi:mono/diheme cytochrome c family protein
MLKKIANMSLKQSLARFALSMVLTSSLLFVTENQKAFAQGIPDDEQSISNGRTLFRENCMVCHAMDRVVVGPALAGVHERRDIAWLKGFIRNSQRMIQAGDRDAVAIYNQFNRTEMPSFNFSDEEILNILAYIRQESEAPAVAAEQVPTAVTGEPGVVQELPGYVTAILIGLLVVLALILVVLVLIISLVSKYVKQRPDLDEADKELLEPGFSFGDLIRSKTFLGILAVVFVAVVIKAVIDGLFTIGIQQGYAPTQPINFSHKIHAGQYEIDCNYCHTGVRKSKQANIPSVNICMNCHGVIKTDHPEVQKIHAAVENNRPVEWVRIHNLPDLAYFNHAQHVNVGGLECQTCHGEIQEMDVVRQHAPLTMGWCINCHRETEVKTEGNPYYDHLQELHSEVSKEPMKVVDIGGTECSRCHY